MESLSGTAYPSFSDLWEANEYRTIGPADRREDHGTGEGNLIDLIKSDASFVVPHRLSTLYLYRMNSLADQLFIYSTMLDIYLFYPTSIVR